MTNFVSRNVCFDKRKKDQMDQYEKSKKIPNLSEYLRRCISAYKFDEIKQVGESKNENQ